MQKVKAPYQCVYSLNNDLLLETSRIAFDAGRLSVLSSHGIDEENLAKETRALLSLDGVSLSPSQFRALGQEGGTAVPSADGLYRLLRAMPRIDPFNISFLAEFEKAYFPSGAPRRVGRTADGFPYPLPLKAKIQPMLETIYRFLEQKKEGIHPFCLGPYLCFQMQAIQPYSHSGEVLSLYLMKAVFLQECRDLIDLPLFQVIQQRKQDVDAAYSESVSCGDASPYIAEMLLCLKASLASALRKTLRSSQSTTPLLEKLLSKMEEGRFYSAQELCALLGLKSRLGLQKNYLRPGLDNKRLVMLNPLVPTDRNQKYKKA